MLILILAGVIVLLLLTGGWRRIATPGGLRAATDLYKASTLTDAQVRKMAREYIAWTDGKNNLLPENHPYTKRLLKLSEGFFNPERYNLGVYATSDVNAFACADGSIRVFSGLMDRMEDEELLAIIGHEMGHIVHRDTLRAMKNAYVASATRNAVSATGGAIGNVTGSVLGGMAEKLAGAKFSRNQEQAADDYAFRRTVQYGADPFATANALGKLAAIAEGGEIPAAESVASYLKAQKSSARTRKTTAAGRTTAAKSASGKAPQSASLAVRLGSMFSTHPDPAGRAARMRTRAASFVRRHPEYYA